MSKPTAIKLGGWILAGLFIVAVPLFLVTNSVSWAVNDLRLYKYGFDKRDISTVTGIEPEGLMAAARQIRGYFNSDREPIDIRAEIFGEERDLFNEREVLHMADVKRLIRGVYWVDIAAAAYLVAFAAAGFLLRGRSFLTSLSRRLTWGGGLTVVLIVLVGVFALAGFESLFNTFHQASFSNDFWRLDPTRDYLVMMFPEGFWFDATLFVGLATIVQALVVGGTAGGFLVFQRRHARRRIPVLQQPSKAAEL